LSDRLEQISPDEAASGNLNQASQFDKFLDEPSSSPEKNALVNIEQEKKPTRQRSEFENFLNEDPTKGQLKSTLTEAAVIPDERAKRVLSVQAATGFNEDLIERNLDRIEKELQANDFDEDKFRQNSPLFAEWAEQNKYKFALTQKEVSKLSYLERQRRYISSQFTKTTKTVELSEIGFKAVFGGELTKADRARQAQLELESSGNENFGIDGYVESSLGAFVGQVPIFAKTFGGKIKGALKLGALGTVAGGGSALVAGQLGPQAAAPEEVATVPTAAFLGGKKGALLGWRYGAALEAAQLEAGLSYLDFEKTLDANGQPIDPEIARAGALIVGTVNGTLESLGFDAVFNRIPGFKQFSKKGFKQLLKKKAVRDSLSKFAKAYAKSAGTEGITEFFQEYVQTTGQELLNIAASGNKITAEELIERITSREHFENALESAKVGSQAGGVSTIIQSSPSLARDLRHAKKSEKINRKIKEISDNFKESKIDEDVAVEDMMRLKNQGQI